VLILVALVQLSQRVLPLVLGGVLDPLDHESFQSLFGSTFTVLITVALMIECLNSRCSTLKCGARLGLAFASTNSVTRALSSKTSSSEAGPRGVLSLHIQWNPVTLEIKHSRHSDPVALGRDRRLLRGLLVILK
jgi:hypothetical protein